MSSVYTGSPSPPDAELDLELVDLILRIKAFLMDPAFKLLGV